MVTKLYSLEDVQRRDFWRDARRTVTRGALFGVGFALAYLPLAFAFGLIIGEF